MQRVRIHNSTLRFIGVRKCCVQQVRMHVMHMHFTSQITRHTSRAALHNAASGTFFSDRSGPPLSVSDRDVGCLCGVGDDDGDDSGGGGVGSWYAFVINDEHKNYTPVYSEKQRRTSTAPGRFCCSTCLRLPHAKPQPQSPAVEHVTCHMSHVTCHMSQVICLMSHVTREALHNTCCTLSFSFLFSSINAFLGSCRR
jgi:hypothetical protein